MRKLLLLIPLLLMDCSTVPLTGRKQLSLIPESQINSMAFDSYEEVINKSTLSKNEKWNNWVREVGGDIKSGVRSYLKDEGQLEIVDDYRWEFNLIAEQTVNAWAMPGGKVAFYEGIMPICEDKGGVAVVMGHEIAHAIARHGSERMSQGLVQQLGGVALAVALRDKPQETQALFMGAYGIGSQVGVMLPFSRKHESEADRMGLIFMAMAGYDPREAPEFWKRMQQKSGGGAPPEFLSTHPSHETRIKNLNKWMPEAMKYYQNYLNSQAGQ